MPVMSELLHVLDASFKHRPQSLKATPPLTILLSVLTNRPLPICQKWTGISRMVSHTQHTSWTGTILHWIAYAWRWRIDINFVLRKHEKHVSVPRQQGKYQLWANWFMCWMLDSNSAGRVSRQLRHLLSQPWSVWLIPQDVNILEKTTSGGGSGKSLFIWCTLAYIYLISY